MTLGADGCSWPIYILGVCGGSQIVVLGQSPPVEVVKDPLWGQDSVATS